VKNRYVDLTSFLKQRSGRKRNTCADAVRRNENSVPIDGAAGAHAIPAAQANEEESEYQK